MTSRTTLWTYGMRVAYDRFISAIILLIFAVLYLGSFIVNFPHKVDGYKMVCMVVHIIAAVVLIISVKIEKEKHNSRIY